jgi:hypothetical protein
MHRTAVDSPNVGAGEASGTKASRPTTQVSIVYCRVVSRTLTRLAMAVARRAFRAPRRATEPGLRIFLIPR